MGVPTIIRSWMPFKGIYNPIPLILKLHPPQYQILPIVVYYNILGVFRIMGRVGVSYCGEGINGET